MTGGSLATDNDRHSPQTKIRNWLHEHIANRFFAGTHVDVSGMFLEETFIVAFEDPADATYFGLKKDIFDIVSKSQKTLDDHAAFGARITGRPVETVRAFICSMSDSTSNYNRGKTTNIGKGQLIQIAAI